MKKNLFIVLIISVQSLYAQNKGDERINETPKYVLRQKDFYEKRVAQDEETNFAKAYYEAYLEKETLRNRLNKKSKTWTPVGPFGYDDLAGIGRVNDVVFHPKDTGTYYICVAQGGLWKSTNSGKSWVNISGDLPF